MTDDDIPFPIWSSPNCLWNGPNTTVTDPENWTKRESIGLNEDLTTIEPNTSSNLHNNMSENQSVLPSWNVNSMINSIWSTTNNFAVDDHPDFASVWPSGDRSSANEAYPSFNDIEPQSWLPITETSNNALVVGNGVSENSNEGSTSNAAGSTDGNNDPSVDDGFQQLVTCNDGWGKRGVDQSRAWDLAELEAKMLERRERNEPPTPTPNIPSNNIPGFPVILNQELPMEAAMWTASPPTGTRVWEMHYESLGVRPPFRPVEPVTHRLAGVPPMGINPRNEGDFEGGFNNWNGSEVPMWRDGVPSNDGTRPVLGARALCQPEVPWNQNFDGNPDPRSTRPWNDGSLPGSSHNIRSLASPQLLSGTMPRNINMNTAYNPQILGQSGFNNMRGDQKPQLAQRMIKTQNDIRLTNNGSMFDFIPDTNNLQTRNRFISTPNVGQSPPCMNNGSMTGLMDVPSTSYRQAPGSNMLNSIPPSIGGQIRAKPQHFTYSPSSASAFGNQPISPSPQPSHIRQQIPQQPRSNPYHPSLNPIGGGPMSSTQCPSNVPGGSLLGQPPPPLLNNSTGFPSVPVCNSGLNNSNLPACHVPTMNRPLGHNLVNVNPNNMGSVRRSLKQPLNLPSLPELETKRDEIQNQFAMLKTNPNIMSNPQYMDIVAELQMQLSRLEAQIQIKQSQLAFGPTDGSMSSGNSCGVPQFNQNQHHFSNAHNFSTSSNTSAIIPMENQDMINQQFTQMCLRPQTGSDDAGGDYLPIGTWIPKPKSDSGDIGDLASRASTGRNAMRGGSDSNWQSNLGSDASSRFAPPPMESQSDGQQWLLIRCNPGNGSESPLERLYQHLFAVSRVLSFHVLSSTSGHVLVCLQSPEDVRNLKKSGIISQIGGIQQLSAADARAYIDHVKSFNGDASSSNFLVENNAVNMSPWNPSMNHNSFVGGGNSGAHLFSGSSMVGAIGSAPVNNNPRRPLNQSMQGGSQRQRGLISGNMH